eukprot:462226_1
MLLACNDYSTSHGEQYYISQLMHIYQVSKYETRSVWLRSVWLREHLQGKYFKCIVPKKYSPSDTKRSVWLSSNSDNVGRWNPVINFSYYKWTLFVCCLFIPMYIFSCIKFRKMIGWFHDAFGVYFCSDDRGTREIGFWMVCFMLLQIAIPIAVSYGGSGGMANLLQEIHQ